MSVVEGIFAEYISMRGNNLNMAQVLRILNPYIETLSKKNKRELAWSMHQWELQQTSSDAESPAAESPEALFATESEPDQDADWLACPTCGKKNRSNAIFCYSCGLMLDISTQFGTRRFTDRLNLDAKHFGDDSILVLQVADSEYEYEVCPQTGTLLVGRITADSNLVPNIDLSEADAESQGVSRLHMAIEYDPDEAIIRVRDLSSMNGTYINERKLIAKEDTVLHDRDEIKLGRLVLRVKYFHPGDEA